jgi:glycosyltransferase involved in cell wall biosynthesis
MKASIVIPTKNRGEAILKTLQSVVAQVFDPEDYEVIVVDSSTDSTVGLIQTFVTNRKEPPFVRYIREERKGVHYARHAGARAMKSDIYVQIEDDAIAEDSWLKNLLEAFDNPSTVCAGGKVLPHFEVEPPAWMKPYYTLLTVYDLGDQRLKCAYVTACNLAVRREALFKVGGFNPDIVGSELVGNGEVGLVEKLRRKNMGDIVYIPEAKVLHCVPASRLTLDYMRWRVYNEGTCTVQSFYQERQPGLLALVIAGIKEAVRAGRHKALTLKHEGSLDPTYFDHEFTYLKSCREARAYFQLAYDRQYRNFMGRENWVYE